jgi:hypothetical protein
MMPYLKSLSCFHKSIVLKDDQLALLSQSISLHSLAANKDVFTIGTTLYRQRRSLHVHHPQRQSQRTRQGQQRHHDMRQVLGIRGLLWRARLSQQKTQVYPNTGLPPSAQLPIAISQLSTKKTMMPSSENPKKTIYQK